MFLIPLTFWFIYHCISFQSFKYFELEIFFQSYINSFLFLIMMICMLFHAKLGCDTIVKDYIKSSSFKKTIIGIINSITFFSLFLVVLAIIRIGIL